MAAETSDAQTPAPGVGVVPQETVARPGRARLRRAAQLTGRIVMSWPSLWLGFTLVHAVAIWQSWVWEPMIYGDVHLYEAWARQGLDGSWWVVLDTDWVYPIGAILPIVLPALFTGDSTAYDVVWAALVTTLNALALLALGHARPRGRAAAWFWLAFLLALGPIFIGRLDGIIAPIMLVALVVAARHPAAAMALATVGAWIKIAPGAVAVALAATSRRLTRDVLVPGALVTGAVIVWALIGGAGVRVLDVFGQQSERGLQVESVAATPFLVARLQGWPVEVDWNDRIYTYEVLGETAGQVARTLDLVLAGAVVVVALLGWLAARRRPDLVGDVFLLTAAAGLVALIVFNKVGSPQFIGWIGPPVAAGIALAAGDRRRGWGWRWTWLPPALGVLLTAYLTQEIYPRQYGEYLGGWPHMVWMGVARNGLVVLLLVGAVVRLVQVAVSRPPVGAVGAVEPGSAEPDAGADASEATAGKEPEPAADEAPETEAGGPEPGSEAAGTERQAAGDTSR